MKLLSADEVKTKEDQSVSEQVERVKKLQFAESESSKRLNAALVREESELKSIEGKLASAQSDYDASIEAIRKEVSSLESRKREALQPTREREKAVADAEISLKSKQEEFSRKASTLELLLAEAIGARGNYERKLAELEKYRNEVDAKANKISTDRQESERAINAKQSRFNDEKKRLREYFEDEDSKLKEKIFQLRKLEKQHG